MTSSPITIKRACGEKIDHVESLLEANGLPYQDVREKSGDFFLVYSDDEFIGTGGIEVHESNGLLRSVVVTETKRGQGYGSALYDALEEHARHNGIETLYLLTTTATTFFRQRGYEEISRETVPSSIRQTNEFINLCPDSAICLKKNLH